MLATTASADGSPMTPTQPEIKLDRRNTRSSARNPQGTEQFQSIDESSDPIAL